MKAPRCSPDLSLAVLISIGVLTSCGGGNGQADGAADEIIDIRGATLANKIAYITSQCFTRTEDAGKTHNPCFSCHVPSREPNFIDDGEFQLGYAFPGDPASTIVNPWTNLFKDRTAAVASIGDDQILSYVRRNNYSSNGAPLLSTALGAALPRQWDVNGNGRWDGYIPDATFEFDEEGFDLRPDGTRTGWRAFAYAPFLGTFWPTNGSTDDVLLRLAPSFRQLESGADSLTIYKVNLAIVTALIQRRDVMLESAVDETQLNVDLDKNGTLATATYVKYDWAPLRDRHMSYVGKARLEQMAGTVHLAAGLFPEGTEFLHSVRYLDLDARDRTKLSSRMKELRYAKKHAWYTYSDLQAMALKEQREATQSPERTRQFSGNAEIGLGNGQGWTYQGFIENRQGELRPQTYEETVYCMGCHGGLGATTDSAFSFPRKFHEDRAYRNSWYHWSQKSLAGVAEPVRGDGEPEYAYYLRQNGAGDEFRGNDEVKIKFFDGDGRLREDMLAQLRADMTVLLDPSRSRALKLNKAYKAIVDEQSFIQGRDASITPVETVHRTLRIGTPTGIRTVVSGP